MAAIMPAGPSTRAAPAAAATAPAPSRSCTSRAVVHSAMASSAARSSACSRRGASGPCTHARSGDWSGSTVRLTSGHGGAMACAVNPSVGAACEGLDSGLEGHTYLDAAVWAAGLRARPTCHANAMQWCAAVSQPAHTHAYRPHGHGRSRGHTHATTHTCNARWPCSRRHACM